MITMLLEGIKQTNDKYNGKNNDKVKVTIFFFWIHCMGGMDVFC